MYSETLSNPLNDLDSYLTYDANELRGSVPSPDPTWLEVEMKIRLANGNQVTVTEHVDNATWTYPQISKLTKDMVENRIIHIVWAGEAGGDKMATEPTEEGVGARCLARV